MMGENYKFDVFYDRQLRLWTCLVKDCLGNQIGEAGYGMSRIEARNDAEYKLNVE